jgi:hypothetical protein
MSWLPSVLVSFLPIAKKGENKELVGFPKWIKSDPKQTWGGDDYIYCMRGKDNIGYIRYHTNGNELSLEILNFDRSCKNGIEKHEIKKVVLDSFKIIIEIMKDQKLNTLQVYTIISEPMKNLFKIMGANITENKTSFTAKITIKDLEKFLENIDLEKLKLK